MLASLNVFLDHPLIGVGPGQYMPVYSVEYQQNLTTKFRDLHRPRRAHNLYLEIAAETGTLGILAFLGIMAALALQLREARRSWAERAPEYADLATAFLLALGVYLFSGLLLHLAFERYLWLLLALAVALLHTIQPELASYSPSLSRATPVQEVHRGYA
jgi:O-antigen ligase